MFRYLQVIRSPTKLIHSEQSQSHQNYYGHSHELDQHFYINLSRRRKNSLHSGAFDQAAPQQFPHNLSKRIRLKSRIFWYVKVDPRLTELVRDTKNRRLPACAEREYNLCPQCNVLLSKQRKTSISVSRYWQRGFPSSRKLST